MKIRYLSFDVEMFNRCIILCINGFGKDRASLTKSERLKGRQEAGLTSDKKDRYPSDLSKWNSFYFVRKK